MAVNKNFVVKNGLEVRNDLVVAISTSSQVGIGTSLPAYSLDVFGGIGVTDARISGFATVDSQLRVGTGGTVLSVLAIDGKNDVGIGTTNPIFLLDVRSPTSTGSTAVYIQGDVRITGDVQITGIGGVSADKYKTKTYTGDGSTLTFALSTYAGCIQHTANSVLVSLNGVVQIAGTNYTVDTNGANVVFSSGDAPLATDTVHILELPI